MKGTRDWLPLFPLDLALIPGALLPLHVFEPRYRALVRRSLEGDRAFGVVWNHEGNLARVGCVARIVRVLQVYPDGRSDILARGEGRFSLLEVREHADGYLEGRVEATRDETDEPVDRGERLLLEQLFHDYAELVETDEQVPGASAAVEADEAAGHDDAGSPVTGEAGSDAAADAACFSFGLAAQVPLGVDETQALLETLSERQRTTALLGHLARLVPRLRAHDKDRRKVRGNGKPVPPEE
jgi:ATP-dependent Lon protease